MGGLVLVFGCGPVVAAGDAGDDTSDGGGDGTSEDGGHASGMATITTGSPTSATTLGEDDGNGDGVEDGGTDTAGDVDDDAATSHSESGEDDCAGECSQDDDCAPGQTCIGCICFGEPNSCAEYGGGVFADCTLDEISACESDAAICVVDNTEAPTSAVCVFECEEVCDCPAPPAGFEAQLACEDLTGEGAGDCYVDCEGGLDCPRGMYCFANIICMYGTPPPALPPYGDCQNEVGECENGLCLQGPDFAVCGENCMDASDCAAPPNSGHAPVTCMDVTADGLAECMLDCSGGQSCPDGMVCDPLDIGICVWLADVPPDR